MTKNEKSIIAVFCLILLVLAGFILVRYYHRVNDSYALSGSTETAEEQIPIAGYTCSTTSGDLSRSEDSDNCTAKRTFTHEVYTPDGDHLTTVAVTVTGSISSDSFAISHISTSLAKEANPVLTVSEHLSDETATVVLYLNQISICHFQYRLSSDGSVDYLIR
jgi:hypothetical protein